MLYKMIHERNIRPNEMIEKKPGLDRLYEQLQANLPQRVLNLGLDRYKPSEIETYFRKEVVDECGREKKDR